MLENLWMVIIAIVSIGILIFVHELGHYWMAKSIGIKVLRFSVGFGKALWRKKSISGTEWVVAAIPFGGYVALLDEREGEVAEEDRHQTFNAQSFFKRFGVLITGSLFNIVFAILMETIVLSTGIVMARPIVSEIVPHSIAAQAGMKKNIEITAIDHQGTADWRAIAIALADRIGNQGLLQINAYSLKDHQPIQYQLNLAHWLSDPLKPNLLDSLGIIPYQPEGAVVVDKTIGFWPAAQSGLLPGDQILTLDNKPIFSQRDMFRQIDLHAGQAIPITFKRNTQYLISVIDIDKRGKQKGYIGIKLKPIPWPKEKVSLRQYPLLSAWRHAVIDMWHMGAFNLKIIYKMVIGEVSVKSLGGPLGLFKGISTAIHEGFIPYLDFLAIVSMGVAVINLLPIPGLDGSKICYLLIERFTGKKVSIRLQFLLFRFGMIILVLLGIQAFLNDLLRI